MSTKAKADRRAAEKKLKEKARRSERQAKKESANRRREADAKAGILREAVERYRRLNPELTGEEVEREAAAVARREGIVSAVRRMLR